MAHITNLFPERTRRAIAATARHFHDRRRDFDDAGVEVNRAARWQLERTTHPRNHALADQARWRAKDVLGSALPIVYEKRELRFYSNHWPRRRAMAIDVGKTAAIVARVFHSLGRALAEIARRDNDEAEIEVQIIIAFRIRSDEDLCA